MNFIFDPSLVLYLPLHERDGSSFMSKDAYGHTGTVTGALWRPDGRYFDGIDDYINCGDLDLPGNDVTIMAWIYVNTAPAPGDYDGIVHIVDTGMHLRGTAAGIKFVFHRPGVVLLDGTEDLVKTSTWHHVAASHPHGNFSTANTLLYVDGVNDTGTALSGSGGADYSSGDTYIGWNDDNNEFFDGIIGEVLIYNRILTPAEIQNNYLATKWRYQ
jgi:hypothetical protein